MAAPATRSTHWLIKRPLRTFFVMMAAALVFGMASYNLFFLTKANIDVVLNHGIMALIDGAFMQLVILFLYGVLSLAAYILLKACEHVLVDKLLK